jgi:hypothetical protein
VHVGGTGILKTLSAVRTTAHNTSVMVVLAVVLPTALAADFVPAPFGESDVPAAWTRIRTASCGERVLLCGVHLEPTGSLGDQLFVGQRRVVLGSSYDGSLLGLGLLALTSTSTNPGHAHIMTCAGARPVRRTRPIPRVTIWEQIRVVVADALGCVPR